MNNKYSVLFVGIVFIFILSTIDALQELWPASITFDTAFAIFLIATSASIPALVSFLLAKYIKNPKAKFNFFLLSSILTVVSLFAWSAGVFDGSAPMGGAQQMHLIFWPVLIPIISLIVFVVLLLLLKGIHYFNQQK